MKAGPSLSRGIWKGWTVVTLLRNSGLSSGERNHQTPVLDWASRQNPAAPLIFLKLEGWVVGCEEADGTAAAARFSGPTSPAPDRCGSSHTPRVKMIRDRMATRRMKLLSP